MTPATSTMRKAFSTSLMDTWSCLEKKSSRSPSSAIEPSLRHGSKEVSAGMRRHSSMPIKSMRPGAIGALTTSGVGGRSEAHHKSARLLAAHGLDQTGNARHADHLWIGECDVEFAEGVRPPEGARTDISIRDEGDVDQRMLRRQSVDDDVEALVGAEGDVFGNVLHDRQACGKAGDSRLAMVGERVVGSRRYASDRHPAAPGGHGAVRSVATEDHDAGNPSAVHQTRGELGILDGSGNRHVEKGDVRISLFALVTPALDAPHDVTAYPARLGHYQHLLDAAGGDRGKYA